MHIITDSLADIVYFQRLENMTRNCIRFNLNSIHFISQMHVTHWQPLIKLKLHDHLEIKVKSRKLKTMLKECGVLDALIANSAIMQSSNEGVKRNQERGDGRAAANSN